MCLLPETFQGGLSEQLTWKSTRCVRRHITLLHALFSLLPAQLLWSVGMLTKKSPPLLSPAVFGVPMGMANPNWRIKSTHS